MIRIDLKETSSDHELVQQYGYFQVDLRKLLEKLNMKKVEETQSSYTFFCLNRKYQSIQYPIQMKLKKGNHGIEITFIMQLNEVIDSYKKSEEFIQQIINEVNKDISKLFITSLDWSKKVVTSNSFKLELETSQQIVGTIGKQFQEIEKYLLNAFTISSLKNDKLKKLKDKLKVFMLFLEAQRKSKNKSSQIDLIMNREQKGRSDDFSFQYSSLRNKALQRLKNRSSNSQQILRLIRIIQAKNMPKQFEQGATAHIRLIEAHYKIYTIGSIYNNIQKQLQKINLNQNFQEYDSSQPSQSLSENISKDSKQTSLSQPKYKQINSLLVVKEYQTSQKKVFENQFTILAGIRQEKSPYINTFYTLKVKNKIQDINDRRIFSDYYKNNLSIQISKKKNYVLITEMMAEALEFFNKKKILHRDLKPENILLTNKYQPKIIDFGSSYFSNLYSGSRVGLTKELMTTKFYNLFYSQLPPELKDMYSRYQFETSPSYDVHAFGKMVLKFFDNIQTKQKWDQFIYDALIFLGQICSQINPEDRPETINIYIYIRLVSTILVEMQATT